MKKPLAVARIPKPVPEHKTRAATQAREALRPHTESAAYNNRSRNNLRRGAK